MRTFIVVIVLVLAVVAGVVFAMGRSGGDDEKVKEPVKSVEPAQPEVNIAPSVEAKPVQINVPAVDKVVVTVNGEKIMLSDVEKVLRPQFEQMESMGRQIPETMRRRARQQTAEKMVMEKLLDKKVAAAGIKVSDADVDAKVAEIAGQQNMSMDEFSAMIAQRGLTMADVRKDIGKMVKFEELIDKELEGKEAAVTDEEAKEFYDKNAQRFNVAEQVQASHILLKTEGLDEQGKADAKV